MQRNIRVSAKGLIIRDGKMAVIRIKDGDEEWYIMPGGGQNAGESLTDAACREVAEELGIRTNVGQVFTSDQFYNAIPDAGKIYKDFGILAVEMEVAGLYWTAQYLHKKALGIMSISDHIFTGEALNAEARQESFRDMMEVALETAWKSLD